MDIVEHRDETGICVSINRTLDLTNCSDLNAALGKLFDASAEAIWINVVGLKSIDSAGLALFLRWHRRALADERRFALVGTTSYHRKLLEITRLDQTLVLFDRPGGERIPPRTLQGFVRRSPPDDDELALELIPLDPAAD